jgi:hypothetical protein
MYRTIRKAQAESEFERAKSFSQQTTHGPLVCHDRFVIEQSQPRLGFSDWPSDQFHLRSGIWRR